MSNDICRKTIHQHETVDLTDGTRHDGCHILDCDVLMPTEVLDVEWLEFVLTNGVVVEGCEMRKANAS